MKISTPLRDLSNVELSIANEVCDAVQHPHVQDQDVLENHKYEMIKLIIGYYLDVKLRYECKIDTMRQHDTFIRHSLTKTVIFKGQ